MAFSGALTLSDLNDFLSPSQACIKPVENVKPPEQAPDPGAAATQISVDSSGNYYEVSASKAQLSSAGTKLQTAQVSLNDCLACSGCITSAESVLITMQSHEEVLSFLSSNPPRDAPEHRVPVISISPQSLASLAASVSSTSSKTISMPIILQRVRAFCRQRLGFAHVYDTTFARHLSLLEQAREYAERKAATGQGDAKLPMLASACPGWICYAEKAHSEMLPFISRTKSPQQVMGSLVKAWMSKKWGKTPGEIYHVSVMPCYDKKLEASRQDFFNEVYQTRDVDCVITTGELELLMREKDWDLSVPVRGDDATEPELVTSDFPFPELLSHPGTSSGSYLQSIISLVSADLENHNRALKLSTRTIRTADYEEYVLEDTTTGEVVFKGAKCYGFRNLQNVVRKVGKETGLRGLPGGAVRGRAKRRPVETSTASTQDKGYDFVEVMACPSGCVNGGGQLRPVLKERVLDAEGYQRQWSDEGVQAEHEVTGTVPDPSTKWGNKEWIQKVESAYWSSVDPSINATSIVNADHAALRVLKEVCNNSQGTDLLLDKDGKSWMQSMDSEAEARRREFFRTDYRKIESDVVGLAVKW